MSYDTRWQGGAPPDPLAYPEFYEGLVVRRCIAFLLDQAIVFLILLVPYLILLVLSVLTFGLLSPLLAILAVVVAFAYYAMTVADRAAATPGMRLMDLTVRTAEGARPSGGVAAIRVALFFFSVMATAWLIVLLALFNDRRRCLHDALSGTVVVRASQAV